MRRPKRFFRSCAAMAVALVLVGGGQNPGVGAERQSGREGAGPRAVAHRSGGRPIRAALVKARAPRPRLFQVGNPAGEPTLGVTKKGWIFFMAAPGGNNTDVFAMRSKDRGGTWVDVTPRIGPVSRHPYDFDPYLYVDEHTSRVFIDNLGPLTCSNSSFSDDGGESWITNPVACGRPVNDHQTIFSGPPESSPTLGYPNIVYYCFQDIVAAWCSKSLDGALTFLPPVAPAYVGVAPGEEGGLCGASHGHGVVGADGTIYLPKAEYCGYPAVAISSDEGASWEQLRVADMTGAEYHEAGVAVDAKGNIYFTWVAKDRLPYLSFSRDDGESWSKPMMIAPPGVTESNLPGIAVGAPGKVAVVYMGSANSPFQRCKEECSSGDYADVTWNGYLTISADLFAKQPTFFSAAVNDPTDPMHRRECGPGRCGAGHDFLDVVIAPDGSPWGAFSDHCTLVCAEPGGTAILGQDGVAATLVGGPRLK